MVHVALNQGVGYGIVLGLGAAFAFGKYIHDTQLWNTYLGMYTYAHLLTHPPTQA